MTTAGAVAIELRKLADSLDKEPEATIPRPFIFLDSHQGDGSKEQFIRVSKIMPHPFKKTFTQDQIQLVHENSNIYVWAQADRNTVCRVIRPAQPAEYECDPLLSPEEEASLAEEPSHAS